MALSRAHISVKAAVDVIQSCVCIVEQKQDKTYPV